MKIANRIVKMVEGRLYKINLSIEGIEHSEFPHGVQNHSLILCKELLKAHFVCVQNSICQAWKE